MKKALFSLIAAGISAAAFAAADNLVLTFETQGPDTYADGSTVLNGECYALVWVRNGHSFAGITVSGELSDPANNKLLLVAPYASGGRCPTVMFEIDSAIAAELGLEDGQFAVYLLDTRVADESGNKTVAGVDASGKINTVNGYGAVTTTGEVKAGALASKSDDAGKSAATGETIATAAALPADKTQPKIKDIRVIGDKVYITVEKIAGATIRVQGATTAAPAAFTQMGADEKADTTADDMIIVRPATGSSGFFRVINK